MSPSLVHLIQQAVFCNIKYRGRNIIFCYEQQSLLLLKSSIFEMLRSKNNLFAFLDNQAYSITLKVSASS